MKSNSKILERSCALQKRKRDGIDVQWIIDLLDNSIWCEEEHIKQRAIECINNNKYKEAAEYLWILSD